MQNTIYLSVSLPIYPFISISIYLRYLSIICHQSSICVYIYLFVCCSLMLVLTCALLAFTFQRFLLSCVTRIFEHRKACLYSSWVSSTVMSRYKCCLLIFIFYRHLCFLSFQFKSFLSTLILFITSFKRFRRSFSFSAISTVSSCHNQDFLYYLLSNFILGMSTSSRTVVLFQCTDENIHVHPCLTSLFIF